MRKKVSLKQELKWKSHIAHTQQEQGDRDWLSLLGHKKVEFPLLSVSKTDVVFLSLL